MAAPYRDNLRRPWKLQLSLHAERPASILHFFSSSKLGPGSHAPEKGDLSALF